MSIKDNKRSECACCGETENLKYCEDCKVWMCFQTKNEHGGCFEWTSSHESGCQIIFNYHHPNLDEELAFYDRLDYFERNPVLA